jgi:hypothetical protein
LRKSSFVSGLSNPKFEKDEEKLQQNIENLKLRLNRIELY